MSDPTDVKMVSSERSVCSTNNNATLHEMCVLAKSMGIPTSGSKADLADRLTKAGVKHFTVSAQAAPVEMVSDIPFYVVYERGTEVVEAAYLGNFKLNYNFVALDPFHLVDVKDNPPLFYFNRLEGKTMRGVWNVYELVHYDFKLDKYIPYLSLNHSSITGRDIEGPPVFYRTTSNPDTYGKVSLMLVDAVVCSSLMNLMSYYDKMGGDKITPYGVNYRLTEYQDRLDHIDMVMWRARNARGQLEVATLYIMPVFH